MKDIVDKRIRRILVDYERGIRVDYDAAVEIASLIDSSNIDRVFLTLPESLKPIFLQFAANCDSERWISIGSNVRDDDDGGACPVEPTVAKTLREWIKVRRRNRTDLLSQTLVAGPTV